jgi:hypothetical protein
MGVFLGMVSWGGTLAAHSAPSASWSCVPAPDLLAL